MSRKISDEGDSVQLALRVPPSLAKEVEDLAEAMAKAGPSWAPKPTRSDVLREAVVRGLAVLRRELAKKKR